MPYDFQRAVSEPLVQRRPCQVNTGVNAALNGAYGVPIALVTGDAAVCREAKALLGETLPTVAVKQGLSRYSARQLPPVRARQLIEEAARDALTDLTQVKPYVPDAPTTIKIELSSVDKLAEFKGRSGIEITGPVTVESRAEDWLTAWNQFYTPKIRQAHRADRQRHLRVLRFRPRSHQDR